MKLAQYKRKKLMIVSLLDIPVSIYNILILIVRKAFRVNLEIYHIDDYVIGYYDDWAKSMGLMNRIILLVPEYITCPLFSWVLDITTRED